MLHDLPGDQAERILILNLGKRDTGWPEEAAVLWKDDQTIDLGTLGGYEAQADANNSHGQVAGSIKAINRANAAVPGARNLSAGFPLYQSGRRSSSAS